MTAHRGFLEHWNIQKSVCNIWQRFSCLLNEEIPKICKKFNSHYGFLSYLQNSTANSAHLTAHFFPISVCPARPLKATVRTQFLPYFWIPLIKHPWKTLVEYCSSGEDVSVNTVIMLRNWGAILADLRSEVTEEARVSKYFSGYFNTLETHSVYIK